MTLIRIDRSSIKKNHNAGETTTTFLRNIYVSFTIKGDLPDYLKENENCYIYEWTMEEVPERKGRLIYHVETDLLEKLSKDAVELEQNRDYETIHHAPVAKYRYNYENIPVECEECKQLIPHNEIIEDCKDDGCWEECPNCQEIDSFDYKYEKIQDVEGIEL